MCSDYPCMYYVYDVLIFGFVGVCRACSAWIPLRAGLFWAGFLQMTGKRPISILVFLPIMLTLTQLIHFFPRDD
jgi:hypothetical protein